ncbi:uncharacterized protein JN550_000602 [Neoarthrinium moseri]|uniref:uncharacterized protein n=1 Tax=Neoarthrinium moseri TaxID=1658444 RepID=UPI001FDE1CEB|nr:uncharacterized protein JN550_000602 [Neoarthrinium moseri]KAI1878420.1 hypothetical protein JN550_000602 [Neoarthrinium moseri]
MSSADPAFGSNNPFRRRPSGDPSSPAPPTTTTSGSAPNAAPGASASSGSSSSSSFLDAASAAPKSSLPPPSTTFRAARLDGDDDEPGRDDGRLQPQPKKIVKKVRVQSPPPSSPEDSTPVRSYPPDGYSDDESSSDSGDDGEQVDPFNRVSPAPGESILDDEPPLPRVPPNPFSKTLQDLEHNPSGQDEQAAAGAKALDVDSFKRLLLTGYANIPGPPGGQGGAGATGSPGSLHTAAQDGASNTDASSVSRQSIFDAIQDTPRTSHDISEPEETEERRTVLPSSPLANVHTTSGRKPPPPPSSRHGKLIKIELGADGKAAHSTQEAVQSISIDTSLPTAPGRKPSVHSLSSRPSSSDINKPLPMPPSRTPAEEDIDSPFDKEAAGKLPEPFAELSANPRPPTPPAGTTRARSESQTSIQTTSSAHRKPAAPPPRRPGHNRVDSKPPSIYSNAAEEDPPRSSLESNRSRADSIRVNISSDKNLAAPVPPPPRRPNHARQASSFTSPTGTNFAAVSSPGIGDENRSPAAVGPVNLDYKSLGSAPTVSHSKDGLPKLSPPPPPPARHSSTRRPASRNGGEAGTPTTRKVSRDKEGGIAPPPPPPRARGSSKGSMSGGGEGGSVSGRYRAASEVERVAEESAVPEDEGLEPEPTNDIMEQIKALQQEVEAARKASG